MRALLFLLTALLAPRAGRRAGGRLQGMAWRSARWGAWSARAAVWVTAWILALPVAAQTAQLSELSVSRDDDGVHLSYAVQFALHHNVEDALLRGVPLHFVADAELKRRRWYWRDETVARASRHWRLAYQPLTRRYRLSLGSLAQNHERLADALDVIRRGSGWRIADPLPPGTDERYYIDYSFRIDTSQLPGPLQLGLEAQSEWTLGVERTVPLAEAWVK